MKLPDFLCFSKMASSSSSSEQKEELVISSREGNDGSSSAAESPLSPFLERSDTAHEMIGDPLLRGRLRSKNPLPFISSIKLSRRQDGDESVISTPDRVPGSPLAHTAQQGTPSNVNETAEGEAPLELAAASPRAIQFSDPAVGGPAAQARACDAGVAGPRDRDPLRHSRFLTFPTQVGPLGVEVHLFDGLVRDFVDVVCVGGHSFAARQFT